MMVARQPRRRRNFAQYLANNAAKGILCENVVTDMILPHTVLSFLFERLLTKYTQCLTSQQRKSPALAESFHHISNSGYLINNSGEMEKVEVSVARYLRTPPYGANRKDLSRNSHTAIRQRERIP